MKRKLPFCLSLFLALSPLGSYSLSLKGLEALEFSVKKVVVNELSLYEMLIEIRDTITQRSQAQNSSEEMSTLVTIKNNLTETLATISTIVESFNQGHLSLNPEIFYKFINLCNFGKNSEQIAPRHIRSFRSKIEKFDAYVKNYSFKRNAFLSKVDRELIDQIILFNQKVLDFLSQEALLGIDIMDKVVDGIFIRPMEFVAKHKLFFLTAGAAAILIAGCWYGYPAYLNRHLSNENPRFNVTQFPAVRQSGNECPLHAVWQAHCFTQAQGNEARMRELMNDRQAFTTFRGQLPQNVQVANIDGNGVRQIIRNVPALVNQPLCIVEHPEANGAYALLNDAWQAHCITQAQGDEERVDELMNDRQAFSDFRERLHLERDFDGFQAAILAQAANSAWAEDVGPFVQANQNFNGPRHQPQTFIANLGGHWITYHVRHDPGQPNDMRVYVANSTNRNQTNNPIINDICDMLALGRQ